VAFIFCGRIKAPANLFHASAGDIREGLSLKVKVMRLSFRRLLV